MKISPKKLIKALGALPKKLAKHSFLTFFIFFLLDVVLGGIVFYKYVILIEKTKVENLKTPLKFDHANYQEVLNQWDKRQKNLEKIDSKQYINPFQETRISFSTSTENGTSAVSIPKGEEIIIPTSTEETVTTSEEVSGSNQEETSTQETSGLPSDLMAKLLLAGSISDFYIIKKERFPSVWERSIFWEEKGIGKRDDYYGSEHQNVLLLRALKKELTE
ncbi:MAG: hypothetical protein NTU58_03075 [Candidatus Nealsonbacteria bacterium]|nr:hypothetical protein [Candidatus Nealsonbacteria bacterium]